MIYLYIVIKLIYLYSDLIFSRLHISALHKFTYGKHILAKLENYYASNQWKKFSENQKRKMRWTEIQAWKRQLLRIDSVSKLWK